ncbi:chromatin remodeling complex subunit [Diplodia corticola]|uniref:Chromatin remodeling complex subunit n=1 Tax=Diplodia corticola TaxID=236234 RepID=A0A1J9QYE7_9PEZI|nr:chromatin remodeling complex subunit [Diplodia corticola]OJD34070.1 chromatin remodeling complex subunit [Diplodia corticola]
MSDDSDVEVVSAAEPSSPPRSRRPYSRTSTPKTHTVQVIPSPVSNPHEYKYPEDSEKIYKVLREYEDVDSLEYTVMFGDTHTERIPFERLLELDNGPTALEHFQQHPEPSSSEDDLDLTSDMRLQLRLNYEGEDSAPTSRSQSRRRGKRGMRFTKPTRRTSRLASPITLASSEDDDEDDEDAEMGEDSDDSGQRVRRSRRTRQKPQPAPRPATRLTRQTYREHYSQDDEDESDSDPYALLQSDVFPRRKRKRNSDTGQSSKMLRFGTRRSDRATRHQDNMEELGIDQETFRNDEPKRPVPPKATGAREVFQELDHNDPFRSWHVQQCDTCGQGTTIGPLIYCQGCILAYHKGCLGHRTGRDHLVTKVSDESFVLQCRRCVNAHHKKDQLAPDLGRCQVCKESSKSCKAFRQRKSAMQEQREREENEGEDPIIEVSPTLINSRFNILFRCLTCWRGFHFYHLPPKSPHHMDIEENDEETAERRFSEYSQAWQCKDCMEMPAKVVGLIAWKPVDEENYIAGTSCENVDEDDKAYLVKWDKLSYFRAAWMPGAWTWGVTAFTMRKAFSKKETGPKMRTEDAIPEEFLRIDIVLDVKYTSIVEIRSEEIDKARIKEVDEALIKYKGLGYEDAVWEKVPVPEDGDRWTDFVTAYNDWVLGRYTNVPKKSPLQARLEKARAQPFTKLEKSKQPDILQSGMELMKYQIDGLNWLYYQWYSKKNGILADEMGLGKTIQVIAFLATLIQDHSCFPFLVVVPNSTCPNWRREIKHWAPSLRVVTYFGSSQARNMAYQYEMFPEGKKTLCCHIVVTSYDAAADDSCRKFFKSVNWAGLVVDEGQRLKNDNSILYNSLNALKIPSRLLLTGTPLQNNARELFNLLQFLDDEIDAASLEEEYEEMTKEKILKLHDLIRPYILRRTKAQVLTFLPPMAQIIVPLSMSVLQKKLYKSILAKNPELLKALFSSDRQLKPNERANLSNILMQLRKCLCHPFIYSQEIEERTDVAAISHRNLVEASAKLHFLELMLPKLRERGHRVLIFSQFLDMLDIIEDFMDGLEMGYRRLDGTIGSLEKQKRIDEFNAPDSPLFAFLLSTRAGGVGINLATADTVIILDPDFNPHQDIQALSRAHRIGQKKKVLCFQLMTRSSAEEKIVQIGRKKMALDHVVVESLDDEDIEDKDVESVLRHGAAELFSDSGDQDIKYDHNSIEQLLDRTQMENTKTGTDASAETQFSFARVWANDAGALEDTLPTGDDEQEVPPDPSVWDKILQEREKAAAAEAAAKAEALGRGKRNRGLVDYNDLGDGVDAAAGSPAKAHGRSRRGGDSDSDTDFHADGAASGDDEESVQADDHVDVSELAPARDGKVSGLAVAGQTPQKQRKRRSSPTANRRFQRVPEPQFPPAYPSDLPLAAGYVRTCPACTRTHLVGACPLKLAGVEHCNLCGLAHFGSGRTCPHIGSETQVREMLQALKHSSEPRHLVDAAVKYLRGVKGNLVQKKKLAAEMERRGAGLPALYAAQVQREQMEYQKSLLLQQRGEQQTQMQRDQLDYQHGRQRNGLSSQQAAMNAVSARSGGAGLLWSTPTPTTNNAPLSDARPGATTASASGDNGGAGSAGGGGGGGQQHDDEAVAAALSGFLSQAPARAGSGSGGS